jgi:hypothetical protein
MADLTGEQASSPIRIVGSTELNVAGVSPSGKLCTENKIEGTPVQGNITAGLAAIVARVDGANLADRTKIIIYNRTANKILYWSFSAAMTTANAFAMAGGAIMTIDLSDTTNIYLIGETANMTVTVAECL